MRVQLLTEGKSAQVYPLVQLRRPNLSQDEWHRFTAAYLEPDTKSEPGERGILTAEDDRGYIFAMLAFTMVIDLRHGRVLIAQDVVAVTVLDRFRKVVISELFHALEDLARQKQCVAVRTWVGGLESGRQKSALYDSLLNRGHEIDQLVLCKTLGGDMM